MSNAGCLRVYLGAAPGVGKTFAMLQEGQRRATRGTDVVVAFVETHGRPHTAEQLGDLPVVPRKRVTYRGATFEEMDLAAVLDRRPAVALVDELAHTNAPGTGANEKRWQDIDTLLAAGIDVISTVNIQHLESLNDVVQTITGVAQRETVPDAVVRSADQIELVDMTPEALRRRMAHGNIYASDKVDAALGNYFRPGNLTALRELALLWLADRVEEGLQRYREQHGISGTWETRERVVVALTGGPEGAALIRRAARIAARSGAGELLAVHVSRSDGLAEAGGAGLQAQRLLVESLGGTYHALIGDDVPRALLDFATSVDATQVVLGASRRKSWRAMLGGPGTSATVARLSGPIDVHLVSHDYVGRGRALPSLGYGLTARRQLVGAAVAVVLLVVATVALAFWRGNLAFASEVCIYLLIVVITSLVGGFWSALFAAVAGSLVLNYYFAPPIHTFTIDRRDNLIALVIFLLVARAGITGGGPVRPPLGARGPPRRGGRDACRPRRQPAAWRAGPDRVVAPGAGNVHHACGEPAAARRRRPRLAVAGHRRRRGAEHACRRRHRGGHRRHRCAGPVRAPVTRGGPARPDRVRRRGRGRLPAA